MKTRVNKHVLMFSNKKTAHVLMYFFQLVLTFTPHYIIMVKGLLRSTAANKTPTSTPQNNVSWNEVTVVSSSHSRPVSLHEATYIVSFPGMCHRMRLDGPSLIPRQVSRNEARRT